MTNVLITSALPYINAVKHLGNLAGSLLPADVHARFRRRIGDDVLFICATDEHGTPAELAAAEAGQPVDVFCAEQHLVQADIYQRLNLSFDHFGRSSSAHNHALTQHFFACLDANGFIEEKVIEQFYSPADGRFLPDRYLVGTCPHCGSEKARGDQCEACTKTLDPTDLVAPRSAISGSADLEIRTTRHLFLRQSALVGELEAWIDSRRDWPPLVTSIARKWLAEGIGDRCITRDLSWGVPVPKPGYEGKVFYVWFDAPVAYIAATKEWADVDPEKRDWKGWWLPGERPVDYLQFLGKDNVPFHAVSFPCTLLGSREPWKTVDVIKGLSWLTYQGGKFSTSQRRGIFLDQALALLPADYWRWWLIANAPESDDTDFTFERFATDVNNDLGDTFGNLVNRVLRFAEQRFGGVVPDGGDPGPAELELHDRLRELLDDLRRHHAALSLRKAAATTQAIWRLANAYVHAQAPWTAIKTDPARAAVIIRAALGLLEVSAKAAAPIIPDAAAKVLAALGRKDDGKWPDAGIVLEVGDGRIIAAPPILFERLPAEWVAAQTEAFAGQ